MISCNTQRGFYVSILKIIQSHDVDSTQVHKALQQFQEQRLVTFIPWGPASIQVALARQSPYVSSAHKVMSLLLANHMGMDELFDQLLSQYDCILKRNTFLDNFRRDPTFLDNLDKFDSSYEIIQDLVDKYRACERHD